MDIDSQESLKQHRAMIKKKKYLQNVYLDFYSRFNIDKLKKPVVELGTGAGFLKELYPEVITSDVITGEGIDKVFYAARMPFKEGSIGAFVMLDTIHHIKDPAKALSEMERSLVVGGKIIMIEPYNSLWGRLIYQTFHHEDFDPKGSWKIKGKGRLSDANGAIPWIIFKRDRHIFEKKFPSLKIISLKPHTPLSYLFSGGLSKPQLVPTFVYGFIKWAEKIISPFNNYLGMFATIKLKKIK